MDVLGVMSEGLARHPRAAPLPSDPRLVDRDLGAVRALRSGRACTPPTSTCPLSASWTVLAFLGLGVSLPSSPGYVGVVQAATVLALALFSVPRTEALSFSLLIHASQFVPVTLYGLALLLVEHVSLSEAARARSASTPPSEAERSQRGRRT